MGQIIGSAAKPKRCNLSKLSQLGTPAAGEYILVSSDNSMNAAGQGNFDCYIVGDGQKAATALPLQRINAALEEELSQLEAKVDGFTTKNYTEGYKVLQSGALEEDATSVVCDKVPVSFGDTLSFNNAYSYICAYDSNDTKLDHWSARNTVALTGSIVQNVAYILASFKKTDLSTAYIKKGTTTLWKAEETATPGLVEKVAELENGLSSVEDSARQAITLANTVDGKIEGTLNYIDGYKVNQDGTLGEDETSIVSDKITAAAGDVFTFNNAYSYICAYDANDVKLDQWSARNSMTIGSSLTTVAYIRVSVLKTNMRSMR